MKDILDKLEERRARARAGGGKARVETQHKRGKLTARERVELLMDKDSFEEFDMFVEHREAEFGSWTRRYAPATASSPWLGRQSTARTASVFARRFPACSGARWSRVHAQKIIKVQDLAMKARAPIVGLFDAGGARIQEGVAALASAARCSSAT